jgi:hypothetical protein
MNLVCCVERPAFSCLMAECCVDIPGLIPCCVHRTIEGQLLKLNSRVKYAADPARAGVNPTITPVIAKSAAQAGNRFLGNHKGPAWVALFHFTKNSGGAI